MKPNSLEQLITDKDFITWVLYSSEHLDVKWRSWASTEEKKELIKNARQIVLAIRSEFNPDEIGGNKVNKIWSGIQIAISDTESKSVLSEYHDVNSLEVRSDGATRRKRFWYYLSAAVVSFFICIWFLLGDHIFNDSPVQTEVVNTVEKLNPQGQKSKIQLPDGSIVFLNSQSKLSFAKGFVGDSRMVQLEGEAYFEVAQDPVRPFIVDVRGVKVIALGTSFNIRSFDSNDVIIQLSSGRVAIRSVDSLEDVYLIPGQAISWIKGFGFNEIEKINNLDIGRWRDGYLTFNSSNLSEVVSILERWYDVDITVDDKGLLEETCTAEFDNETLRNVMES